jgi:peroxiredoxin
MKLNLQTVGRGALFACTLLVFVASSAQAGLPDSLGQKLADFTLEDYRGKKVSLSEEKSKATVLLFLGTECPLVSAYAVRLNKLFDDWEKSGVRVLGINSNQQDSLTEIARHAEKMRFKFPILKDVGNVVADQLGAQRTPEAYVLDGAGNVVYRGRIDDQFGIGYQRPEPTRPDLVRAVEDVLSGKSVEVASTEVMGCRIGRVHRPDPSGKITYTKEVSRILQKRCTECHHEGDVAPFSLTSYEETIGWAEMIKEVVEDRRMPPWLASPAHQDFVNNPSLTEGEKQTLFAWIESGCPKGDEKDLPEPIKLAKGWCMSQPDEVFYMSDKPYKIPAEGTVRYQYYVVDPGNKEDKWIKEAEVRAGTPSVVHHVIVFIQSGEGERKPAPQMAYAPGMPPRKLPPGRAIRLPANCKLIFQCHYTPNGIEREDRSYVGFKYADPAEVTHEVIGGGAGVMLFAIPPHEPNFKMVAEEKMRRDTWLIGMNPHMHVRGKDFKYEVIYPDGKRELLLDVPRYDFNWQLWYNYAEPKFLPKGTRMICTAHFDNSQENPSNPDPNKTVRWGEQTWDEMMFGFFSVERPLAKQQVAIEDEKAQNGN